MNYPASRLRRNTVHACAAGLLAAVALLFTVPVLSADQNTAEQTKKELIEIMKVVNFVPQLGKEGPFCKAFYEDFKQQKNIEHIQPIVKVETYDDPVLKPYREKCPKLDFRRSLSHWAKDAHNWTEEEWEAFGQKSYGLGNFQLYKADVVPGTGDGYIFYYEGIRTIDRRLPTSGPMIEQEIISPGARGYHFLNLVDCKVSQMVFNQGDSKWTRGGIVRYKNKSAIYELLSTDQRDYYYLTLHIYSEKLKRIAPTCSYHKPR